MTVLTMAAGYGVMACVYAAFLVRRFGSRDRVVLLWLSVLWPLSLLALLVLLPLERTRFASSEWRLGGPSESPDRSDLGSCVDRSEEALGSTDDRAQQPVAPQPTAPQFLRGHSPSR